MTTTRPVLKTLKLPSYDSVAQTGSFTNGKVYYSVHLDQMFARHDGGPITHLHAILGEGQTLEEAKANFDLTLRKYIRNNRIHKPDGLWFVKQEI